MTTWHEIGRAPITTGTGFTDWRPGEPKDQGSPFFQNSLIQAGCGYATAGFPPARCAQPPMYAATVEGFAEPFHLCAEHAARFRTARLRPSAMWSL